MISTRALVTAYAAATLLFSTVTIAFEWLSPIDTPEGPWDWYRTVGVRNGIVVAASHAAPGGGWALDVHAPRFIWLPAYAGAGPESGGVYVAPWFLFGAAAFVHCFVRAVRRPA